MTCHYKCLLATFRCLFAHRHVSSRKGVIDIVSRAIKSAIISLSVFQSDLQLLLENLSAKSYIISVQFLYKIKKI